MPVTSLHSPARSRDACWTSIAHHYSSTTHHTTRKTPPDGVLQKPLQGGLAKTKLKVSLKCREFCLQEVMELRERLGYQARTQSTVTQSESFDANRR